MTRAMQVAAGESVVGRTALVQIRRLFLTIDTSTSQKQKSMLLGRLAGMP